MFHTNESADNRVDEQAWLTQWAEAMAISLPHEGICAGYAQTALYFVAMAEQQGLALFIEHIQLINDVPVADFLLRLEKIAEKNKQGADLTREDYRYQGIKPLLNLMLALHGDDLMTLLQNKKVHALFLSMPLVHAEMKTITADLTSDSIEQVNLFVGTYPVATGLGKYFAALQQTLSEQCVTDKMAMPPFQMLLATTDHLILVIYNPKNATQPFHFIEADSPALLQEKFDVADITKRAQFALTENKVAVFTTRIFATKQDKEKISALATQWLQQPTMQVLHRPTKSKLRLKDSVGATLLHLKAQDGCEQDLASIIKMTINIDAIDYNGYTPLHHATYQNHGGIMRQLINHGASTSQKDMKEGCTAFHFSMRPQLEAMTILMEENVNPNKRNFQGETALHYGILQNSHQAVQALLTYRKTKIEKRLQKKATPAFTPLLFAIHHSRRHHVVSLLNAGADIHAACFVDSNLLTELLMKHKKCGDALLALLKEKNSHRAPNYLSECSALFLAVLKNQKTIVTELLKAGADPSRTTMGITARELAVVLQLKEIVRVFDEPIFQHKKPKDPKKHSLCSSSLFQDQVFAHAASQEATSPQVKKQCRIVAFAQVSSP